MIRRVLLLAALSAALPARAVWTGNPAHSLDQRSAGIAYDTSDRDVTVGGAAGEVSLDARGFYLEHRSSLSPAFQGSIRILPFTGRAELEGLSFNPHLAGVGAGLHFAPPEPLGPVQVGLQALWLGQAGSRKRASGGERDRVLWSEISLAGGASFSPVEPLSVYGGASWTKLDVEFKVNGVRSDWREDQPWGAFLGAELNPDPAWTAALELRTGHEKALSVSLRYNY